MEHGRSEKIVKVVRVIRSPFSAEISAARNLVSRPNRHQSVIFDACHDEPPFSHGSLSADGEAPLAS